jgi:hypothetical protein
MLGVVRCGKVDGGCHKPLTQEFRVGMLTVAMCGIVGGG